MQRRAHSRISLVVSIFLYIWIPASCFCADNKDDLASFFEDLFSGDDNSFLDMFNSPQKESKTPDKKATPAQKMPTKEELAACSHQLQSLLKPLAALIKNMHFNHRILGGAVYERVQAPRALMTALESTLLHWESILPLLPAKELEQLSKILTKETPSLLMLLRDLLEQASRKISTSIDSENAFILGKTQKSPVFMPASQRRKLEAKILTLSTKLKPVTATLQKLLLSPDIKKLFPEAPAKKPKMYAPTSSSGRTSSAPYRPQKSNSRSNSSSYGDSYYDPYSSQYSSDYPYYDEDRGFDQGEYGNDPKPKNEENKEKPASAAPAPQKQEPKGNLAELVAQLKEHETIAMLEQAPEAESMLTDPNYFSSMATTFETMFKNSSDGGLGSIAHLLKAIEKAKEAEENKEPKEELTSPHRQGPSMGRKAASDMTDPTTQKQKEDQEERLAQEAALATYETTKQMLVSGLMRLYHTPAPQLVAQQPATREPMKVKPIVVMTLPQHEQTDHRLAASEDHISRNELDQEDAFCRAGQKKIGQFLDLLEKKCGMGDTLRKEDNRVLSVINRLETLRSEKIRGLAATLSLTPLTNEALPTLQSTLDSLADMSQELRRTAPTIKTSNMHFYKTRQPASRGRETAKPTPDEQKAREEGHDTSRWEVTQALRSLESKLETYKHATQNQADIPENIKELERSILHTKNAWGPSLILKAEPTATPRPLLIPVPAKQTSPEKHEVQREEAADESTPLTPTMLQQLMQRMGKGPAK